MSLFLNDELQLGHELYSAHTAITHTLHPRLDVVLIYVAQVSLLGCSDSTEHIV